MFKSGLILTVGRILVALLYFARNVLIANLISVEQYGIASTFVLALTAMHAIGDVALDRLIVQHKNGNNPGFVSAIQFMHMARTSLVAIVFFLAAGPVAELFNQPELTWAYQLFAIVPLVEGFLNMDVMRRQREMRFDLVIKAEFFGILLSLAVVAPFALWFGDFRVMIAAIFVEQVVKIGVSHYVSQRPFDIRWDKEIVLQAIRFGWPLLISGLLGMLIMQGDRVIVANQFTAADLGRFSAALTLTIAPQVLLVKVADNFFLPLLSRSRDDAAAFQRMSLVYLQLLLLAGTAFAIGFTVLGVPVFNLFFHSGFEAGAYMVILLSALYAQRMARMAPMLVAMSLGSTKNYLLCNLTRLVSLPLAVYVAVRGGSIADVVTISIAGEFVSLILAYVLVVIRQKSQAVKPLLPNFALGFAVLVMTVIQGRAGEPDLVLCIASILALAGLVVLSGTLRRWVMAELLSGVMARLQRGRAA